MEKNDITDVLKNFTVNLAAIEKANKNPGNSNIWTALWEDLTILKFYIEECKDDKSPALVDKIINSIDYGNGPNTVSGQDREQFVRMFNWMAYKVNQNAIEKGWWEKGERNVGEVVALIHTELSEAFEVFRKHEDWLSETNPKTNLPHFWEEFADVIIRIMDYSSRYSINLGNIVVAKHNFNTQRQYRHGGKNA